MDALIYLLGYVVLNATWIAPTGLILFGAWRLGRYVYRSHRKYAGN